MIHALKVSRGSIFARSLKVTPAACVTSEARASTLCVHTIRYGEMSVSNHSIDIIFVITVCEAVRL